MNPQKRKSILALIQSTGLALIILVAATWIIIGFFGEMLGDSIKYGHRDNWLSQSYDIFVFILYNLIIVIACFFLVRQNPKSVWSVPLICNAYSVAIAITEPAAFWKESFGIIFCFGWVLSIVASVIGARIGKSNATSDNH